MGYVRWQMSGQGQVQDSNLGQEWVVYRCDWSPEDRACGIRVVGSDPLEGPLLSGEVVGDTNREECCHHMRSEDAEHVVALHNADLRIKMAAWAAPVVDVPVEFVPPDVDSIRIDACARVANDVVNAAGVVGSWRSDPWDEQPESVRAGIRTMVASVLTHEDAVLSLTEHGPGVGGLFAAAVRSVARVVDELCAPMVTVVPKLRGRIDGMSDADVRKLVDDFRRATLAEPITAVLVDGNDALTRLDVARGNAHAEEWNRRAANSVADQRSPVARPDLQPTWSRVIAGVEARRAGLWPALVNDVDIVVGLVVIDMRDRDRVGRARCGVPLTAGNGRDQLVDLYQELLDAAAYSMAAVDDGHDMSGVHQVVLDLVVEVRDAILSRGTAGVSK